jgi:putative AdoMet-dependent methyltransferase
VESPSFPSSEFDLWAETYDQDVQEDTSFPFAGYPHVLTTVVDLAAVKPGMRVLDLGTGTANLATKISNLGCQLWCSDFSSQMLTQAKLKLPQAQFVLADLRRNWPVELNGPFDRIVSAYVFHHFPLGEKTALVNQLTRRLAPGGFIVIADIAFLDTLSRDAVRLAESDLWEEEYYWIADETLPIFKKAGLDTMFQQVSYCAGIFVIRPE